MKDVWSTADWGFEHILVGAELAHRVDRVVAEFGPGEPEHLPAPIEVFFDASVRRAGIPREHLVAQKPCRTRTLSAAQFRPEPHH
ncbi:hypothetical protein SZ00_06045 (plasmid) [Rhodococcus sp. AD45]|nr:hypothetical protein SZ00_06045 [Rhodococcus sp. AD45]